MSTLLPFSYLQHVHPTLFIQSAFALSILLILFINAIPILAHRFLRYGARNDVKSSSRSRPGTSPHAKRAKQIHSKHVRPKTGEGISQHMLRLLDLIASIRVPHAWFKHFYILSVSCSLFWGYQLWTRGYVYRKLASTLGNNSTNAFVEQEKLTILWTLMLLQGSRRLYESFAYAKPSRSTMWIGHYIMGLGFYFLYTLAIAIEGVSTLSKDDPLHCGPIELLTLLIQTICCLFCMYRQNVLHHYLHTLPSSPNYQIPSKDEFQSAICPHYGYEICIYWLMAFMSTVWGKESYLSQPNYTLFAAYTFVLVNLRTTALGTRDWSRQRFGEKAIKGKALWGADPYH